MNTPRYPRSDAGRPNRRQFLQRLAFGGMAAGALPHLSRWIGPPAAWAADAAGGDASVLVILQLAGGNDGLNTLIPIGNDHYSRARPQLGIHAQPETMLNPEFMLHPSLIGFKQMYDRGWLSAIHAVGYPRPNRSHFRSMEIWQTASDSDRVEKYGWIGRCFDQAWANAGAAIGIALTGQSPQSFASRGGQGMVTRDPDAFRAPDGMTSDTNPESANHSAEEDDETDPSANTGGSIGGLGGQASGMKPSLDRLRRIEQEAVHYSRQMQRILAGARNAAPYPSSRLARDFSTVGRLISGRMPTRMYYLSHGGYDTHVGQAAAQARRLRELGDALLAFMNDMDASGQRARVAVMVFSEFGRRIRENASGGTDHGAAGPVFVCGGGIPPGLHGTFPSLAPEDSPQGDVPHTCDFRSIYATLLRGHLRVNPIAVLGREFPPLPTSSVPA
ncbi:MAG: DUF1501 domain-containing protein [Kiritimatiellae bacterium]|nr:DUF1501 domain-containing protein [Kiritimatiellia bacterium]